MDKITVGDKVIFVDEEYARRSGDRRFLHLLGTVVEIEKWRGDNYLLTVNTEKGTFKAYSFRFTFLERDNGKSRVENKIRVMWERQPFYQAIQENTYGRH